MENSNQCNKCFSTEKLELFKFYYAKEVSVYDTKPINNEELFHEHPFLYFKLPFTSLLCNSCLLKYRLKEIFISFTVFILPFSLFLLIFIKRLPLGLLAGLLFIVSVVGLIFFFKYLFATKKFLGDTLLIDIKKKDFKHQGFTKLITQSEKENIVSLNHNLT